MRDDRHVWLKFIKSKIALFIFTLGITLIITLMVFSNQQKQLSDDLKINPSTLKTEQNK